MSQITKLILIATIFLFVGCATDSQRLSGKWRSNNKLTAEFNNKYARLTDKQKKVFSQLFGTMEISYLCPGKCELFNPSYTIKTDKKKFDMGESKEIMEYKIIYQNEKLVVILYEDFFRGETVKTLNFVDKNTYWIYIGNSPFFDDMHIREYFKKIE